MINRQTTICYIYKTNQNLENRQKSPKHHILRYVSRETFTQKVLTRQKVTKNNKFVLYSQ